MALSDNDRKILWLLKNNQQWRDLRQFVNKSMLFDEQNFHNHMMKVLMSTSSNSRKLTTGDDFWKDNTFMAVTPDSIYPKECSLFTDEDWKENVRMMIRLINKHICSADDAINIKNASVLYADSDVFGFNTWFAVQRNTLFEYNKIKNIYDHSGFSSWNESKHANAPSGGLVPMPVEKLNIPSMIILDCSVAGGVCDSLDECTGTYGEFGADKDGNVMSTFDLNKVVGLDNFLGTSDIIKTLNVFKGGSGKKIKSMLSTFAADEWSVVEDGHLRYKFDEVCNFIVNGSKSDYLIPIKNPERIVMKDLVNFPRTVWGSLMLCSFYTLETMKGFPREVVNDLHIYNSKIPNSLCTDGAIVHGNLYMYNNVHTSNILRAICDGDLVIKGKICSDIYCGTPEHLKSLTAEQNWFE